MLRLSAAARSQDSRPCNPRHGWRVPHTAGAATGSSWGLQVMLSGIEPPNAPPAGAAPWRRQAAPWLTPPNPSQPQQLPCRLSSRLTCKSPALTPAGAGTWRRRGVPPSASTRARCPHRWVLGRLRPCSLCWHRLRCEGGHACGGCMTLSHPGAVGAPARCPCKCAQPALLRARHRELWQHAC